MKNLKSKLVTTLKGCFLISFVFIFSNMLSAQNNAQYVTMSVPNQVTVGQSFAVSITFKNNGTTSWTSGGANPFRLGTQNDPWNIWNKIRVELPTSPVAPGQSVTFNFNCIAPSSPGTYGFKWRMVQELIQWFGAYTPNKNITVVGLQNNAQFISMTAPSQVVAGKPFTATIKFKNNGTNTWKSGGNNPHRLGTQNSPWNIWNTIRVELPSSPIAPGQYATFTVNCIAPTTPGNYGFKWRMVQELVEWFGAYTTNKTITVVAEQNNSQFVSISVPNEVTVGQTFTATVKFKNNGTKTWKSSGSNPHKLGSQNPQDNTTWGFRRVALPNSQIAPGATATFTFTCTAPTTAGTYNFRWRMVQEAIEWFGAYTTNKQITVKAAPLVSNAQFISMHAPDKVDPGQDFTVFITYKNTGQTTWTKTGTAFKLGSRNPTNNTTWGKNRIDLPKNSIAPDGLAKFYFTVTAPTTPGDYYFRWSMIEGNAWFGGLTTNKKITVSSTPLPCQ